jgi:hypothetical protein
MKRLPCPKPRPKRSGATLRLSAFALLAPLHEIEKEPLALLLTARHPQTAAHQKLVELTARTQRLPVARQPVFRRLERVQPASGAAKFASRHLGWRGGCVNASSFEKKRPTKSSSRR